MKLSKITKGGAILDNVSGERILLVGFVVTVALTVAVGPFAYGVMFTAKMIARATWQAIMN